MLDHKQTNGQGASLDRIGPRIAVVGVGGAGSNAVDNMIRSGLQGVSFLVCNTDAQALNQSLCPEENRVCLGFGVTQGLGAGSSPENGRLAAEESIQEVMNHLKNVHMVFITAGMGGGTGTGGAPFIAKAAKEMGILTVGVVTKPFHFEGSQRMRVAEKGIEVIRECVDTLLVIPNQNLFRLATKQTTVIQAFAMADEILYSGVRTFTDLMIKPGLVNSDFADICTVMRNMHGKAMMGTGEAKGEARATEASEKAIGCLLLDDVSIHGAQAVLINVTGGPDLTLYDVDEAIGRIKQEVDNDASGKDPAQIIFGATFDQDLEGVIRVSVVATGIRDREGEMQRSAANHVSNLARGSSPISSANTGPFPGMNEEELNHGNFPTMGSRHGEYNFEEASFPTFALNEESEDFNYNAGSMSNMSNEAPFPPAPPPARKESFFGRMFGRRREPVPQAPSRAPSEQRSFYQNNPNPLQQPPSHPSHAQDHQRSIPIELQNHKDSPFGHGNGLGNGSSHPMMGGNKFSPMLQETEDGELEIPSFLRHIKAPKKK